MFIIIIIIEFYTFFHFSYYSNTQKHWKNGICKWNEL